MARARAVRLATLVVASMLTATVAGQTPSPASKQQNPPGRGQRGAAGRVGRPPLPPISANMTPQQVQAHIDGYALVQAERELQLTDEQYPNFLRRYRRLQDVRRRHLIERRKIMGEISGLIQGDASGRDEGITDRLRALKDVGQRTLIESERAYDELDSGLTAWQRGRFRLFEEQLERLKIQLLGKIGAGR